MKKNSIYTLGSLIILLICAFVFVILPAFTGSTSRQDKIPAFGKYDGKEIRYEPGSQFNDFVTQYGQMFQNYGQQIDSSTYFYIFNYAFNSTVTNIAYTNAVKKSGYAVPNEAINRQLRQYFSDENGKYSSKLYKQTPASQIAELRKTIEDSLIASRFYDDNFASETEFFDSFALYGIKHADKELDFLASYAETRRGFNMAVFPLNTYPQEEKLAYAKANPDKFNKYDFSVITVTDKSTANNVAKRLANEEITFEDAISEYSEKNYSNTEGKLTYKYQYQIENILKNKDDMDGLKAAGFGDISSVIETTNGFSIFKCDATMVKADFDNPDTVNAASSYISIYESGRIEDYFTAKAKDFTSYAMNYGFDAACTEFGVENVTIEPFPLNYGSVSVVASVDTSLTGLANADKNEKFLKTAFSMKKDEMSDPLVMNNNVIVLQFTTEETVDGYESSILSDLQKYDESTAQSFILDSPKLENNFTSVYFDYFMN